MANQMFLTGTWLENPEVIFVGRFWTAPGWDNQEVFWLKIMKVKLLVKRMEM